MSLIKTDQLTNLNNDGQVEVLEGLKIPSGKKLSILGPLGDSSDSVGTSGKILSSTVSGVAWITPTDLDTTYAISAADSTTSNTKIVRLTAGGAGTGTDDIEFQGDSNITLSRSNDRISFSLVQNISTTSNVQFGDITATGDLSVQGELGVTSDLVVGGALKTNSTSIVFNEDKTTGTPTENATLTVKRGTSPTAEIRWNEGEDRWQFTNDGLTYYNILLPAETDFGATEQFGASGDPTIYTVTPSTVTIDSVNYTKLTFSVANSYKKFSLNNKVKVFGASATTTMPPELADGVTGGSFTAQRIAESAVFGSPGAPVSGYAHKYYKYWIAQYGLLNGDIGVSAYTGEIIENIELDKMNGANYNKLELSRSSGDYGLLVYRAQYTTEASAILDSTGSGASLVAILGPQELGSGTSGIVWNDYGGYDVPSWTIRETDGRYKNTLLHFPLTIPTVQKRGWAESGIKDIGANFIVLDANLTFESTARVVHDDTTAIQAVIDNAKQSGQNYVFLPGGTFLIKSLSVPDDFSIKGLGDATVLKKQYFHTDYINTAVKEGVKGSLIHSENYNFTSSAFTGPKRLSLSDFVIDGNKENNIRLSGESNQSLINLINSEFVSIQNMRIQNSVGPVIFGEASFTTSIENCTFLYGSETERDSTAAAQFTDSENLRITDSLFFGFPGPVDATTSQVVGISASIIRNCGTGIRIYGAGKTNVLNNLILGPDDEWLPTPDIYDSDYNSVNYTINRGVTFTSPTFQYIERGQAKDLSDVTITGHLFPINQTGTPPVDTKGSNILTEGGSGVVAGNPMFQLQSTTTDLESGYIIMGIPASETAQLDLATANQYFAHEITGSEFISKGTDLDPAIQLGVYDGVNGTYTLTLSTSGQKYFEQIMIGDKVKILGHNSTPNLSSYTLTVADKIASGVDKKIKLTLPSGVGITTAGTNTGYIKVENIFIIARGVVGVI